MNTTPEQLTLFDASIYEVKVAAKPQPEPPVSTIHEGQQVLFGTDVA